MTATATQLEHSIGVDGLFVLRMRDGVARIRGVDGATARVTSTTDLEDEFQVERGAGSLSLQAGRAFELRIGRHRRAPEIDVELPRHATLAVDAASADLSSASLTGEQRYHTVSGDIVLSSVEGVVAIGAVSGDVSLVASGALRLEARSVSGDVEVRAGQIGRLIVGTTSGDIRVAGELGRDTTHRIETVSGDVLLALAGGVRLVASSVAGEARSSVPHRSEGSRGRRVLIVGDGAATIETRTMSGDVRLVEAHEQTGAPPAPPAGPAATPSPPGATSPAPHPTPKANAAIAAAYDEQRLRILRALERGEIDVAEAGRRLEALDAGFAPDDVPTEGAS